MNEPRTDHFGPFCFDHQQRLLLRGADPVRLPPKATAILALLLASGNRIIEKEKLLAQVWPDTFVEEGNLTHYIYLLRRVLNDGTADEAYIETVPTRGYRFIAPLQGSTHTVEVSQPLSPRLAVVPFASLNGNSDEFFAVGLSDQLVAYLGRMCRDMTIVAPLPAALVNKTNVVPRIDRLDADYVLSGSVLRVVPHVRVTAKLVRVVDQACLWTDTYLRDDGAIFFVQDEITRNVVRAVSQALPAQHRPMDHLTTAPALYEQYLKGCFFVNKWNNGAFAKAVQCFEQVIAADPDFAPAHAALAIMHVGVGQYGGMPPAPVYARITSEAASALALCDDLPEAHMALAWAQLFHELNLDAAEASFLRAIDVNPSASMAYLGYSQVMSMRGHHDDAIPAIKRAREMDPLNPFVTTVLACAYYFAGQPEDALPYARSCVDLEPSFATGWVTLGWVYEAMGEFGAATGAYHAGVQRSPEGTMAQALYARSCALNGEPGEARQMLEELLRIREAGYVPPYWLAWIYGGLGEEEGVCRWLETAVRERCSWRVMTAVDPKWKPFAHSSRFRNVLHELGLECHHPKVH